MILTFSVSKQCAVFFCTSWRFQSFGFLDELLQKLFSSINLLCANFSNLKGVVGFRSRIPNDNFGFYWSNDR
ncbi:hypothetical protein NC652_011045 [Populus alba x Populus x berolinensis]|nr:hypothetical protein NC652_011045 [Populus alba x Populus x berolinensis]